MIAMRAGYAGQLLALNVLGQSIALMPLG